MRRLLTLLSVAAAIALAAPAHGDPSPSPTQTPDPAVDADFLAQLRQAGLSYQDPAAAIAAARTVCDLVDSGEQDTNIVNNLQLRNPGFGGNGAAKFTAIAANSYCPHYLTGEGRPPKSDGTP
jgi:hypothetical protein